MPVGPWARGVGHCCRRALCRTASPECAPTPIPHPMAPNPQPRQEITETERVIDLCAMAPKGPKFGYALANGTVGVYNNTSRCVWGGCLPTAGPSVYVH
jgi:hypothetical protein